MTQGEPHHHPLERARDRETTHQIQARFLSLNEERLERALQPLSERGRNALTLLPLLLHSNHPRLPGFSGTQTPAGIPGYSPSAEQLQRARKLARGFRYSAGRTSAGQLAALYVMGSVGTVAQSATSDMDFWLCVCPNQSQQALAALADKTQRISQWAATQGLEWHFFIMDAQAFAEGQAPQLSSESSGSAQHFLLLDEFYRSAILLAGQQPLWWYLNSANRQQYLQQRQAFAEARFIRTEQWLDFGPACHVPPEEFVSAAIWQLYKAIHSPHKSLLKLWLLEVYLGRYPAVLPLCDKMKLMVYAGNFHALSLDPYLLLLQELSHYFTQRKEFDRLELMRQCFYIKLARRYRDLNPRQHGSLLAALEQWGWSSLEFEHLDNLSHWNAQQVLHERRKITRELTTSYRQLLHMARQNRPQLALAHRDMDILGRKLFAAFERSEDKIERIAMGLSRDLSARHLLVCQQQQRWALYLTNHRGETTRTPLITHPALPFVLLWAYLNGLINPQTHLHWPAAAPQLELQHWLRTVDSLALLPWPEPEHQAFTTAARADYWALMVNDPALVPDFSFYSDQPETDPFNTRQGSLLQQLQLICRNSWGEIHWYNLGNSLAELVRRYGKQQPATVAVRSLSRVAAKLIEQRLNQLFERLRELQHNRLLIINHRQLVLWEGAQSEGFERAEDLLSHLSQARASNQPLLIDQPQALPASLELLKGPAQHPQLEGLQIYYRVQQARAQVLLYDERGSLVAYHTEFYRQEKLLQPLHHFLRAILPHLRLDHSRWMFGIVPIKFYQLLASGRWQQQHAVSDISRLSLCQLHITVQDLGQAPDQPEHWTLSAWLNGEPVAGSPSAIARALLALRASGERYPVHITDLEIEACKSQLTYLGELQSSHYLKIKIALEQAIHCAMQAL